MGLATFNSQVLPRVSNESRRGESPGQTGWRRAPAFPRTGHAPQGLNSSSGPCLQQARTRSLGFASVCGLRLALVLASWACFGSFALARGGDEDPSGQARKAYEQAKKELQEDPANAKAAWQFARTTFDLADAVTTKSERADFAQQGIKASTQALEKNPNAAPLHYYLGLNQGELARTKTLGALKLVDQMEREFLKAIELDASFDYAGPDRSLGLLYRDAPALASIGSRVKARAHLARSVELAPLYPENRLNLIESELKWNDRKSARRDLKLLEDSWPAAHAQFAGPAWSASWTDWESRLDKIKRALEEPTRLESPRH